jgi:hypothetical protein
MEEPRLGRYEPGFTRRASYQTPSWMRGICMSRAEGASGEQSPGRLDQTKINGKTRVSGNSEEVRLCQISRMESRRGASF